MNSPGEHERRAGVPHIVETDPGEARASEERLEGAGDEVAAINGCPNLGGEDQPVFLPESVKTLPLRELKFAVSPQSLYGLVRQSNATLPFGCLGGAEERNPLLGSQKGAAHSQCPAFEVYVLPLQAQELSLP